MENVNLDSVQRDLRTYWQLNCRGDILPARKDIHPEEITGLLRHIGLIDVARDKNVFRFRYRLVGTNMNFVFGEDYSGRWLHEAKQGPYMAYLNDLYTQATQTRSSVFASSNFAYQGGRSLRIKRLLLPLASNGRDVDMLLFSNTFASDDHDFGFRPYPASEIVDFAEEIRLAA